MKKVILVILTPVIIVAILLLISPFFVPKWLDESGNHITKIVRGFYAEEDNSLDILFMGNSDMYRGIMPMDLWNDYGIASYSYTSPGQRAWTSYYVLLDALRSQHPDIIVLNVDGFLRTNQSTESCYHKTFDNMEFSLSKLKALNDPSYNFSLSKKLSFLFPILRFHSRITELTKEDFTYAYGYEIFPEKGYDMIVDVRGYKHGNSYMQDKNEKFEIPKNNVKYLDKIRNKCAEEGIKLILVELPSADSWSLAKSEAFTNYAEKNNIPFIDFNLLLDEIDLDWNYDTCDKGDHLNIYGARKVTKYMGDYLSSNYHVIDRRQDKKYQQWKEQYKQYCKDIEEALNEV